MFPSDVLLPENYKSFAFVDGKLDFNPHWDITWSFSFALTGEEHGFSTFLTQTPSMLSAVPGHYMGNYGSFGTAYIWITDEFGTPITDEGGNKLAIEELNEITNPSILSISFDTTGYSALSNTEVGGNAYSIPNSIIIRDNNHNVIFNQSLSSLSTEFVLTSSSPVWQTLRFRFANACNKISIDYRRDIPSSNYYNLLELQLSSYDADDYQALYPGFSFCSPISSDVLEPSTLSLKNFHVQGNVNQPTYE